MASGMIPDTLRAAIIRSFPELADAQFTPIVSWDSVAVDVDDRLIFKFLVTRRRRTGWRRRQTCLPSSVRS